MKLKQTPELHGFLATYFADSDPDQDQKILENFIERSPLEKQQQLLSQIQTMLAMQELPLDEFGSEANRWFADQSEAHSWLSQMAEIFEKTTSAPVSTGALVVLDSNGAPLNEGDSVQVIKDLKVKGGSSDLKRGTLIKKIHLIQDSEAIECRVEGSTLVLKTCFLKKV